MKNIIFFSLLCFSQLVFARDLVRCHLDRDHWILVSVDESMSLSTLKKSDMSRDLIVSFDDFKVIERDGSILYFANKIEEGYFYLKVYKSVYESSLGIMDIDLSNISQTVNTQGQLRDTLCSFLEED